MNWVCSFLRDEKIANYLYDFDINEKEKLEKSNTNSNVNINEYMNRCCKIIPHSEMNITVKNNENKEFQISNNISRINLANSSDKSDRGEFDRIIPNTSSINLEMGKMDLKKSDLQNEEKICDKHSNDGKLNIKLIPLVKIIEKRKKNIYKFRFIDLIIYHLCCHSKKNSYLNRKYLEFIRVNTEIESILDIRRILYQTQDHENLKMVLLNYEQYALLNFITKNNLGRKVNNDMNKYLTELNYLKNEENLHKFANDLLLILKDDQFRLSLDSTTSKLIEYFDRKYLDSIV